MIWNSSQSIKIHTRNSWFDLCAVDGFFGIYRWHIDGDWRDNTVAWSYYANNKSVFLLCGLESFHAVYILLEAIFTLGKCSTSKGTLGNRFSLVNVSPPFYPLWSQSQYHWIHVLYDRYECLNSSMWKSQRRCTQVFSRDQVYGSPHKMLSSVNFSENVLDSIDNEFTPAILLAKILNLFRWFSIVTRDWLDDALRPLLLNVCTLYIHIMFCGNVVYVSGHFWTTHCNVWF